MVYNFIGVKWEKEVLRSYCPVPSLCTPSPESRTVGSDLARGTLENILGAAPPPSRQANVCGPSNSEITSLWACIECLAGKDLKNGLRSQVKNRPSRRVRDQKRFLPNLVRWSKSSACAMILLQSTRPVSTKLQTTNNNKQKKCMCLS